MNNSPLFSETQQFKQWWIWLLLLAANGLFIYGIYVQVVCGHPWGSKPAPNLVLYIGESVMALISFLFLIFRLKSEIREDGIYYQFLPFHMNMRHKSWSDISKCWVREYAPVKEYGGWGLRMGIFGAGKAINMSGNKGIQMVMQDKTRLLIGTQKAEEVEKILKQIGKWNAE